MDSLNTSMHTKSASTTNGRLSVTTHKEKMENKEEQ